MAQTNTTVKAPSVKPDVAGEETALILKLDGAKTNQQKVEGMLALSNYYRLKPGEDPADLSKALNYAKQAGELSNRSKHAEGSYKAGVACVQAYLEWHRMTDATELLKNSGDSLKAEIARMLSQAYNDYRYARVYNYDKSVEYAKIAVTESAILKNRQRQINSHNQLGYVYWAHNKFDQAEEQFLEVIKLGKNEKYDNVEFAYSTIIRINEGKGYLNLAIKYGLEALDYVEVSGKRYYLAHIYEILARVNKIIGEHEKSIAFFEAGCVEALRINHFELYWLQKSGIAESLLSLGKNQEAKKVIEDAVKISPPTHRLAYANYYLILGEIHTALGEYDSAYNFLQKVLANSLRVNDNVAVYRALAELNFAWKKFDECKLLTEKIISDPRHFSLATLAYIQLLAYRADSALGNHESGIQHLLANKKLNDSMNNIVRVRQMQELAILHETEKVKQDVTLKQQSILLLQKQKQLQSKEFEEARLKFLIDRKDQENSLLRFATDASNKDRDILLKQKSISELRSESESRRKNLETANLVKNITFVFITVLITLLVILYRQYKAKKKSQDIISSKNAALETLLDEKVWLLKEVHHRVKNNLQTVVSLLESQSVYLEKEALEANLNSRNRVYAMSLVHKKLYQSENVASIQVEVYLPELISHLRESLDLDQKIRFRHELDSLQLDVSQAISLGLILNEAITNAIKHAFPNNQREKVISVSMKESGNNSVTLTIADNGNGLPKNFDTVKPSSLGLKLMKGLSEDIEGKFSIQSVEGTTIIISFHPKKPLSSPAEASLIQSL